MRTTIRRGLPAVLLALVLLSAAPSADARTRHCGDYRGFRSLLATNTTCDTAKKVVRGWTLSDADDTGDRLLGSPARGWRCRFVYNSSTGFRCFNRRAVVTFGPGPGF